MSLLGFGHPMGCPVSELVLVDGKSSGNNGENACDKSSSALGSTLDWAREFVKSSNV